MANNVMNMDGSFKPFRAWCQHVLPLVYDDSLSYMELLNKVITYINSFGEYLEEYTVINKIVYEGIWDITKNYKVNSVVSDNGYGYLSMQAVPAGVPISSTDYWLKIADFAGEIIDLGERVLALEGSMTQAETDIDALESSMSSAQSDITSLNGSVTSLGTRMSTAEGDISELENLNWLYNKNVAWFGDSVAKILIPKFENMYSNITISDNSYNGEPMAKLNADFSTCGYARLMSADLSNYDYVFIQYGVNDWQGSIPIDNENHNEYTFGGALETVLTHIKSTYPTCIPVVIMPTWVNRIFSSVGRINNVYGSIEGYINHAIDICNKQNVDYINMYTITGINEDNYTSLLRDDVDHVVYVHPTDATALVMNKAILSRTINTGHCFGENFGGNHACNIIGSLVPSVSEFVNSKYMPCVKYGGNLIPNSPLNLVNSVDNELVFKVSGNFNNTGNNAPIMHLATYAADLTQIEHINVAVIAANTPAAYFEMYFKMQKAKYFKFWFTNIPESPYMIIEGFNIQIMNGTEDVYTEIVKINPVANVLLSNSTPNPKIYIKNGMLNIESITLDIGDNFSAGAKIADMPNALPVNQYSIALKGSNTAHWINLNGSQLLTVTSLNNGDWVTIPAQVIPIRTHDAS